MRGSLASMLIFLAAVWAPPAAAAARDAVARVTGCGPPALATFVGTGQAGDLLAVTLRSAVIGPGDAPCAAPVLQLPEGRGRLRARVGPSRAVDDLAVLEVLPGQPLPPAIETLVVAERAALDPGAGGARPVRVLSGLDDRGEVQERLARFEGSDLGGFTLRWSLTLTWPWWPGAPVIGDGGRLLGLLRAPEGEGAAVRGTSGALHALLNLNYDLKTATPAGRYGIWLARPRDAAAEPEILAARVRRELDRLGLAGDLWEVRDLGFALDAPEAEILGQARRLGGSVNAALVVGSTFDQGADKVRRHRAVLVQIGREAAVGDPVPGADPSGAGRRGEALVLPMETGGDPRMIARAAAALCALDTVRQHPTAQPDPRRTLLAARALLGAARAEHDRWRAGMSRASPQAGIWAREGAATLAALDAELLELLEERAGPAALPGRASPSAAAELAWARAAAEQPREPAPCAWVDLRRLPIDGWLARPPEQRPIDRLEPLLAAADEALLTVDTATCPRERAGLQARRGRLLLARGADPEADLRAAIAAFEEAEEVFTLAAAPLEWAHLQVGLGEAWLELPTADRAGAHEAALGALRAAEPALDPAVFPRTRALLLAGIGDALAEDPVGDPFDNRRRALQTYEQALASITRERDPLLWARIRNGQGAALQGLPWQDPPEHLREAQRAHQEALQVFTRDLHPLGWARTHRLLADAIRQLPSEPPHAAFAGALLGLRGAAEVFEAQRRRREWALTWRDLGDALRASPLGERAANLDEAILAYANAHSVFTREADPQRWAETWQRIGQTWRERRDGDRAENLARSVTAFEEALKVFSPEGNPIAWELCQGDLFVAQAWQTAVAAERAEPGGAEARRAAGEAALQEALLRRQRRLPQAGEDLFAEAAASFAAAAARSPDDPALLEGQALAHWYQARYAEAAAVQARVVALRPNDPWAARSLTLYRLRADLASRPEDPEAWALLGVYADGEGDHAGAAEAWARALTLRPGDGLALGHLVRACLRLGRFEQAGRAVDLALVHAPDDPAVLGAAVLFLTQGEADPLRARPLAARRFASAPDAPEARADLALIELFLGRTAEALGLVHRALDREPAPEALVRLHALRLAAGLAPADLARDLGGAWAAVPPGATVEGAWPLLVAHAEATLPPERLSVVREVLALLQAPRDPASDARLTALLSTP